MAARKPPAPADDWLSEYESSEGKPIRVPAMPPVLRPVPAAPLAPAAAPAPPVQPILERATGMTADELDHLADLIVDPKQKILACEHNAAVLIAGSKRYASLKHDDFLGRIRFSERDWIDSDDIEALIWLQSQHRVAKFTLPQCRNAVRAVAVTRRHDSLRDFVLGLPQWDGIERITQAFSDAWGALDSALTRAASRNFFIAMIARALDPGAQVDTLWTFEGRQGSYKSRSLRALGGSYHSEISAAIGTADFQRELRGIWLAELSELDSLRGKEASTIKRILSAPSDRFVDKYDRHAATYPRRAISVATTNECQYWQDSTGARRLIPILCGDIRVDIISGLRIQWFSEAAQAYRNGEHWWEYPESINGAQDARQQVDPWEDLLSHCVQFGRKTLSGLTEQWPEGNVFSADIMRDWLRLEASAQGQVSAVRLGKVMRRLGFTPTRTGKERIRGWEPIAADTSESPNE